MALALSCQKLCFSFPEKQVISDLSFDLEKGRICAVLGRNGSGKTTLIHCINRILTPDSGRILVKEKDIAGLSRMEIAARISLVPQEHLEIFPFQVLDVVVMGRSPFLSMTRRPGSSDYHMAEQALSALNARHLASKNFNRISGGERQMVLLARALVQASEIMLLDEPTNHLDFNNQFRLMAAIKALCREKKISIVAAMHDPNLAAFFADDVIMIKEGRLMAGGPVERVMTAKAVSALYETPVEHIELDRGARLFFPETLVREGP